MFTPRLPGKGLPELGLPTPPAPVMANTLLTFQITGSPLHALIALIAPILSDPRTTQQGNTTDV